MENQKEIPQVVAENPVSTPAPVAVKSVKVESYEDRVEKMSDKALLSEIKRQGRKEARAFHPHGVILADVLGAVFANHIKGKSMIPR